MPQMVEVCVTFISSCGWPVKQMQWLEEKQLAKDREKILMLKDFLEGVLSQNFLTEVQLIVQF